MQGKGFFPLFFDIEEKRIVVIGGGKIGTRRVKALAEFHPSITIISPSITKELETLIKCKNRKIEWIKREYKQGDCRQAFLVIAATEKREINEKVGQEAKKEGAFVTVADAKEESNVYFPGIARENNIVIGVTTSGRNHTMAKKVTEQCKKILKDTN